MIDLTTARTKMVDNQLRTNDVTDLALLTAMGDIAREAFVPKSLKSLAYIDEDLILSESDGEKPARYLTRPASFARMLQRAAPDADDVALLIGCASGYGAAVLARLAGAVVALEEDEELADAASDTLVKLSVDNAAVVKGPLNEGWAVEGPYDVIIIEGAVDDVPDKLFEQLKDGGRLVCVKGGGLSGDAVLYTRSAGEICGRSFLNLSLKPLPGFTKPAEFVF